MNSCMAMWSFSIRPEMLGSLVELPLTFPNAYFDLDVLEQACRSLPAQAENRNGEAWKWSYSQWSMVG